MNNKLTPDELSVQIYDLLSDGQSQEAIDICTGIVRNESDIYMRTTAMLLRAYSHMAAGDRESALSDHSAACSGVGELLPIEQLGIAEDALKANMPFDYCAGLFSAAGERFEKEENDPIMAAGAYNKAGICMFRQSASIDSEKAFFLRALEAIEHADKSISDTEKLDVLSALVKSNLAECLVREGSREQATALYQQASDAFSSRLDDDSDVCLTHYAVCQRCLSDLYRSAEENIQAYTCLSRSITELEHRQSRLSDQLRMHLAVCYNARGTLRFQMGDYEGEVSDCTRSLELREGMEDDPASIGTVLSNRAEAYSMLDQLEPAREDFRRSIDMFDSVGDDGQAAASAATRCYSLGLLYAEHEKNQEACVAFRSAAERLSRLRSSGIVTGEYRTEQLTDIEALCRMRLGSFLARMDERDYFDSITENREAIRLTETLPLTVDRAARMAALHLAVGELLEMFDELDAANEEYSRAEQCRSEGIELVLSGAVSDDAEEYTEEQLKDQRSIWEDLSGGTPQA